ncbi:MAG: PAS domain-containing protein [Candidatus Eisenbacteria bacterium]|nr:PAS domain-containing protein [Candidatus Eisenbacteria bacterium]
MPNPEPGAAALALAALDSLTDPVLVADTDHVVRYMNRAALAHYTGGSELLGTSLLDCHNEASNAVIVETLEAFRNGEEERLISESPERRIYMRAVRDDAGTVVGYYERYERPRCAGDTPEHPDEEGG